MDNSLILAILNIADKNVVNTMIDNSILDKNIKLCENQILDCLKKYKEIDSDFEIPSLEYIKKSIEESVKTLLKSEKLGIKTTNIFNDDFPKKLKEIEDRSILIFYKGDLSCLYEDNSIAIIGSRTPTENGEKIGQALGYYYAKEGFTVVSGLADGCDISGHKGCLKANGKTVATLPCGLDESYLDDKNKLIDEILSKGGCLISEYKIGTPTSPENFIERDRLQAALSLGVVVVECAIESGTMYTVRFAEKYGKKVAVSMHKDVKSDIETVKGNLYLLENNRAIALNDINDYKKYKNILFGYKIYR